ncbi:hypothetical protein M758_4G097300 [Ceratodon purpureus]|nr:hypothetical protein M758_4G097300 [Ceratodon purpureus]
MDSRLHVTEADAFEVQRVLKIAVMCAQVSPDKRSTMFRVVAMLAGDANVVVAPIDDSDVGPMFDFTHYQSAPENSFYSSVAP